VLGLEWGQISGRRLSNHHGQLGNRPTARVPTA
jgi:hypothetical protein